MTNLRLAVTSRSAAFSSPAWARRANLRSSSASVISGSFWMSWRYWSNAVEGDERKKPLDLLSVEVCIRGPVGLFAQAFHWLAVTFMGRTIITGSESVNSHVSCHTDL